MLSSGIPHVTVAEFVKEQQKKRRDRKKQARNGEIDFAKLLEKEINKNDR